MIASFGLAQVPTGRVVGKVTDEQGVALPGVTVEATSPRLVGTATSITDEGGTYRLLALSSGTYTITFSMPGFKQKIRKDIILQLEQTLTLNETLSQSAVAEEITVVGQSPLIDVKSTTKGATLSKDVFMQLPRSRNFQGLLSTVPGVQTEGVQGAPELQAAPADIGVIPAPDPDLRVWRDGHPRLVRRAVPDEDRSGKYQRLRPGAAFRQTPFHQQAIQPGFIGQFSHAFTKFASGFHYRIIRNGANGYF